MLAFSERGALEVSLILIKWLCNSGILTKSESKTHIPQEMDKSLLLDNLFSQGVLIILPNNQLDLFNYNLLMQ